MVSIFREKLDNLMGKNRNMSLTSQITLERYTDKAVCHYYLVSICPHDLFPNSKHDLGV